MAGMSNIFGKTAVALALVAALTGCTKASLRISEEAYWAALCGDKPICVAASPIAETKATELADGSNFGVFAFFQEGVVGSSTAHWSDSRTPSFMFNQLVEKDAGAYTYTPIHYWPSNEENTISFWAYSPYDASVAFYESGSSNSYIKTSSGIPDVRFTVTSGKDDFMTAEMVKDKTYENCDPVDGTVDFNFHHRLAKVEFKAKPAADYITGLPDDQKVTFKVKKIEILYSYNTADFHQNSSDNSVGWSNHTNEQASAESGSIVALNNTSGIAIGTNPAVPTSCTGSEAFMIPQSLRHNGVTETGNDVIVRITYLQIGGGMDGERSATGSLYIDDVITAWTPNSHYVYTFALSPSDGLHITVNVQPWDKWRSVSDYRENVTVTYPLTFDANTYNSFTTNQTFTVDGVTKTDYSVVALKSNTVLTGSFIFDTPYNGTWYAVLESINGSEDGSIVFDTGNPSTDGVQISGSVGDEVVLRIKARDEHIGTNQFARLRVFCVTQGGQVLAVQDGSIGGSFIIAQYVN